MSSMPPSRRFLFPKAVISRAPSSPSLQPTFLVSKLWHASPESQAVEPPFAARSKYLTLVFQGDKILEYHGE